MRRISCITIKKIKSFERTHTQEVDLLLSEIAPASAREILLGQTGEIDAVEFRDTISEMLENAAHDTIASRVDLDTGLIAGVGHIADGVGVDFTVVELDSVGDALHILLGDFLVGPDVIDFLLDEFGVGEFGGEVAVICEQEHTGGVAVKTAYGIDALAAGILDKIKHGQTAVGVIRGGDAILRFVEEDVALALGSHHLVVEFHDILGCDLDTEFGDDVAVDLHLTARDEFISLAAGADTGVSHKFVEANLHVGIDSLHLIFNLSGARNESAVLLVVAVEATLVAALVITVLIGALLIVAVLVAALLVVAVLVAALLVVAGLIAALLIVAGLVTALLVVAGLITPLIVAGLIAALIVAGLIAALLIVAGLVTALIVAGLIAALIIAGLITALIVTGLVTALIVAGLIATLLTVIVIVVILMTGLIATLLLFAIVAVAVIIVAGLIAVVATLIRLVGVVATLIGLIGLLAGLIA